jgi:hypothetical protein
VLMALAVPRIWRKLTVTDASYPDASYRGRIAASGAGAVTS